MKIGPEDPEIIDLQLKKEKNNFRKVKYIAQSASLPSGLKYAKLFYTHYKN